MSSHTIISNTLAGVLIAVMNITVAISVAALMFSGMPADYFAPGIVVLLIGTVVIGLGGTLFCDFGGVICAPRSGLAPVFATITGAIYASLAVQSADPSAIMPTMLVAIMVASMATGVFLILLGQLRLGNLVRYIPYPVMGGFFAGIGFIFVKGGLTVAMGHDVDIGMLQDSHRLALAAPAVVFAVALYLLLRRFDHWATFPLTLIAGFAAFYAIVLAAGVNASGLTSDGWLPAIRSTPGILFPVVSLDGFSHVSWMTILEQSGGILVVALLSAIILLLDISGIEIITRHDLNPDKELRMMGAMNIVSGAFGGYPGVHVASDTAFTFKLGGDRRLMGFVYAATVLVTILVGTDFIGRVPTFILGGLLVYVGLDFLVDWVWKTRKELPLADYLIVLAILAVIAAVDILPGVAFGFAVAVVLFVINYSRLSVIKSETTGADRASNVDRDLQTREYLNEEGDRILIMVLQGFIFFGTSDKLMNEIRDRIEDARHHRLEFLVLDFHHVSQLDTSAIKAFTKIAQLSEKHSFHVVITGADEASMQRLGAVAFLTPPEARWKRLSFETLNDGIAWCEEVILSLRDASAHHADRELLEMLGMITGDAASARALAEHFEEVTVSKGEHLFHQGERGDSLYLVKSGSVAVVISVDGRERVLRRYTSGAILGEMALYTGEPRSASVIIEEDAVLYRLSQDAMRQLQFGEPVAAGDLHTYIVKVLSERLSRANRELQQYL